MFKYSYTGADRPESIMVEVEMTWSIPRGILSN